MIYPAEWEFIAYEYTHLGESSPQLLHLGVAEFVATHVYLSRGVYGNSKGYLAKYIHSLRMPLLFVYILVILLPNYRR